MVTARTVHAMLLQAIIGFLPFAFSVFTENMCADGEFMQKADNAAYLSSGFVLILLTYCAVRLAPAAFPVTTNQDVEELVVSLAAAAIEAETYPEWYILRLKQAYDGVLERRRKLGLEPMDLHLSEPTDHPASSARAQSPTKKKAPPLPSTPLLSA